MIIIIIQFYEIKSNFYENISFSWFHGPFQQTRKTRRILNNKISVAQPQKLAIMRLSNLTNLRENTNKLRKPVLYSARMSHNMIYIVVH